MGTHGDIKVIDVRDGTFVWLHAFTDGNYLVTEKMLRSLPDSFVRLAELSYREDDGRLGRGWWFDQWSEEHYNNYLSVTCEACAPMIAGLIVASNAMRWLPVQEEHAPWHNVGEEPDFMVVCDSQRGLYRVRTSREIRSVGISAFTIRWRSVLFTKMQSSYERLMHKRS